MKYFLTCIMFILTCSCSVQLSNGQNSANPTPTPSATPSPNPSGTPTPIPTSFPTIIPTKGIIAFNTNSSNVEPGGSANISLILSGETTSINVTATIAISSSSATITPTTCQLNNANNMCNILVNVSPTAPIGQTFEITATAPGYDIQDFTDHVIVSSGRTITFVNKCSKKIWFGIVGAGFNSGCSGGCPAGSQCSNKGGSNECYWNVPKPANNDYLVIPGSAKSVTIPNNPPYGTIVWDGAIGAREDCDPATGICKIGNCNTVNGGQDMSCQEGLAQPASEAEITMQTNTDNYDVSLVNGVSVPMSFTPNNNTFNSTQDPYNFCGGAGVPLTQKSSIRTLNPAYWQMSPQSTGISTPNYTAVSGSLASNTKCSTNADCSSPNVCGYSVDALAGSSATYQLSCGIFTGYYSGDQLCSLNPNASGPGKSPFNCGGSAPMTGNPNATLGQLFKCGSPPYYSPFNLAPGGGTAPATDSSQVCGCTDWNGIASSTAECTSLNGVSPNNQTWINNVLPTITWVKKACPTCYTYAYDDPSSSFTCYTGTPNGDNNSTNYTVTFCPTS